MADEAQAAPEATPGTVEAPAIPDMSFAEHVRWRSTGELPKPPDETPAAAGADAAPVSEPQAKTEPDSGTEDKEDQEEVDTAEGDKRAPHPSSRQRKIDKLTRENYDLQRRLEEFERRPPPPAATAQPPAPVPPVDDGAPQLKDFKTLQEHSVALNKWALQKALMEYAQEQAIQREITEWAQKEESAAKLHSDYYSVTEGIKAPKTLAIADMRNAIAADPRGPEILYHLAKSPEELGRIAKLTPIEAVLEIGRLSAKLAAPPAPQNGKPQISGAPRPVSAPSRPAGNAQQDSIHDERVQADFKRWVKARTREAQK